MAVYRSIKISYFCKRLLSLFFILGIFLSSCDGLKHSEEEKIKKRNLKVEPIIRKSEEYSFLIEEPKQFIRNNYPWEERYEGKLAKITKEYFRCKGSSKHPPLKQQADPSAYLFDCKGPDHHSLPIRSGKEFVYPILLELLNYLQKVTGKKVIITCGHRCPSHNTYSDSSIANQASKHLIGAEVDFYVQGFENRPEEIIQHLMNFYQQNSRYKGQKDYVEFKRYDKKDVNVRIMPWMNKEIFIKLYQKDEGRDFDNHHPFPYIAIQVRIDRETNEKVISSFQKGNSSLLRY